MLILVIFIIVISLLFTVPTSDEFYTDTVIESVGVAVSEDYHQYGWWQDYTIYARYTFENPEYENNVYLEKMTDEDIVEFNLYLENFEEWVSIAKGDTGGLDLVRNYDFKKSAISTKDYCYIDSNDELDKFVSYDLYFYDAETEILYYFHNNI